MTPPFCWGLAHPLIVPARFDHCYELELSDGLTGGCQPSVPANLA